jgi:hypothetical protein
MLESVAGRLRRRNYGTKFRRDRVLEGKTDPLCRFDHALPPRDLVLEHEAIEARARCLARHVLAVLDDIGSDLRRELLARDFRDGRRRKDSARRDGLR